MGKDGRQSNASDDSIEGINQLPPIKSNAGPGTKGIMTYNNKKKYQQHNPRGFNVPAGYQLDTSKLSGPLKNDHSHGSLNKVY